MRLLVVGFADSVHIVRYLQLLDETGWDVHLFDSRLVTKPHPELRAVTLHPATPYDAISSSTVKVVEPGQATDGSFETRVDQLGELLDALAPDIVHSHEIQHGAVLVDSLRRRRGGKLQAPWIVTNWGSDILWFGRDPVHAQRLRSVLGACDYYGAECHRDVALARAYGLQGRVIGVWPVTGGIDLDHTMTLRTTGSTSSRRAVAVKGFSGPIGQADIAFTAIERCMDLLDGWEICVYQLDTRLDERYRDLAAGANVRRTVVSKGTARQASHDDLLAMHGRARVSLALNRSDALSTSFLEAMAMGSFPVQSNSACGHEITPPGRGALFVPATDIDAVTAALRRALTDDALVDAAAEINKRACVEHLDRRRTRARVIDAYERVLGDTALKAVA